MYYVYILKSKKKNLFYTGCTNNMKRRLQEHNAGKNLSTKHMRPLELIHCEKLDKKKEARERELYLKSGIGREKRNNFLRGVEQSGSSSGSNGPIGRKRLNESLSNSVKPDK